MKTHLFSAGAAACMFSAVLLAQSAQPPSSSAQKSTDTRVTVSGCVERADQVAGNTATTTVDSLEFVLIKPQPEKPTGTTGTATADAAAAPAADRMYRLDGRVDELNPHVGQKVEVSGTVADLPTAPAGTSSSTSAPRLKVESIKTLSPTCAR